MSYFEANWCSLSWTSWIKKEFLEISFRFAEALEQKILRRKKMTFFERLLSLS
jgi:hypothetical protein